jgi:hypothetical protein
MKKTVITILVVLILIFIVFLIAGSVFTGKLIEEKVDALKSTVNKEQKEYFEYSQIRGLPLVVQKYFEYAVEQDVLKPQFVRLKHKGEYKQSEQADWKDIQGEKYFSVNKPGYIWSAKLVSFNILWLKVIDTYVNGQGGMIVKFLSSMTISELTGKEMNQSDLVKYLTEMVFFPTALLPSKNVQWRAVDQNRARVTFSDSGMKVSAVFTFNSRGEVIKIKTKDKYRLTPGGFKLSNYTVYFSDYEYFSGFRVPTKIEGEWNLENGDYKYAKFDVTEVEYDVSKLYDTLE